MNYTRTVLEIQKRGERKQLTVIDGIRCERVRTGGAMKSSEVIWVKEILGERTLVMSGIFLVLRDCS